MGLPGGGQISQVRRWRSEVKGRRLEVGGQRSDVGSRGLEVCKKVEGECLVRFFSFQPMTKP